MDCRKSALLLLTLGIFTGGCITPQTQPTHVTPPANGAVDASAVTTGSKREGPSKESSARLTLAYATMKERQAQDTTGNPEGQAKLRDEAREGYQAALRLDPNSIEAARGLARCHVLNGSYDQAFDVYKKAVAKQPKSTALWYDMGMAHNRRREFNESIPCFKKALELEPDNRQLLTTLGLTLARTGQTEQALPLLTKASGAALAQYNLARMQLQLGQPEQARQHLNVALRENPALEPARELLANLDTDTGGATHATATGNEGGGVVQTGLRAILHGPVNR